MRRFTTLKSIFHIKANFRYEFILRGILSLSCILIILNWDLCWLAYYREFFEGTELIFYLTKMTKFFFFFHTKDFWLIAGGNYKSFFHHLQNLTNEIKAILNVWIYRNKKKKNGKTSSVFCKKEIDRWERLQKRKKKNFPSFVSKVTMGGNISDILTYLMYLCLYLSYLDLLFTSYYISKQKWH